MKEANNVLDLSSATEDTQVGEQLVLRVVGALTALLQTGFVTGGGSSVLGIWEILCPLVLFYFIVLFFLLTSCFACFMKLFGRNLVTEMPPSYFTVFSVS